MVEQKSRRKTKPPVEARVSPIHGRGVYATRRIAKGTNVIEYVGEIVTFEEGQARYDDDCDPLAHVLLFNLGNGTMIDGGSGGNISTLINHSCEPNCKSVVVDGRIYIRAIRTIQAGEELSYDYLICRSQWTPEEIGHRYACNCGAPKCRGTMMVLDGG